MGHRPVHFQLYKITPDVFSRVIVPPPPNRAPPTVSHRGPRRAAQLLARFLLSLPFSPSTVSEWCLIVP